MELIYPEVFLNLIVLSKFGRILENLLGSPDFQTRDPVVPAVKS